MSREAAVNALLEEFRARATDAESQVYLRTHAPRYRVLLEQVGYLLAAARANGTARLLDVGPGWESEAIRRLFPEVVLDTLGFADARFELRAGETHIEFDLNEADDPTRWPEPAEHDLVIAAEVVEHLHTAPQHVLRCLATFLRPGGVLLLQTPNAAAASKRLKLLRGENPFEPLRLTSTHAGHVREYTVEELLAFAREAGFQPIAWETRNYFDHGARKHRVLATLESVIPAGLRDGITASFRRPL